MRDRVEKNGLQIDAALAAFVEDEVLAPQGKDSAAFWAGLAALLARFAPVNRALLAKRDDLQAQIDAWHGERAGQPIKQSEYQQFLRQIGYLVPEPAPFAIGTQNVDPEIATMAGPQLVVPMLNARFPAQCGQCALGQPLRCVLWNRRARCRPGPARRL